MLNSSEYKAATMVVCTKSNNHSTTEQQPFAGRLYFNMTCKWRLLPRVLSSIQSAKASRTQLSDMPLRSDTQALRLIASIPLIQRREKCSSREEKSAFTQWFSSVYARSLKDQARKSKYPRTQILELRTQPKLSYHSSATFIPTQSNNLNRSHFSKPYSFAPKAIQESKQSYIGISLKLYSFLRHPIQLSPCTQPIYETIAQAHLFITRTFFPRKSESQAEKFEGGKCKL